MKKNLYIVSQHNDKMERDYDNEKKAFAWVNRFKLFCLNTCIYDS